MGNLRERNCCHCKNLFEAVSMGVCEKIDHEVKYAGDEEKALNCDFYENKYYQDEIKLAQ